MALKGQDRQIKAKTETVIAGQLFVSVAQKWSTGAGKSEPSRFPSPRMLDIIDIMA